MSVGKSRRLRGAVCALRHGIGDGGDQSIDSTGYGRLDFCVLLLLEAQFGGSMRDIVSLALYSREKLGDLRRDTAIDYDHLERGILHVYTNQQEFDKAVKVSEIITGFGCERRPVDADECLRIEPALKAARPLLVGGDYTPADESGDAMKFTQHLATLCEQQGVRFRYGVSVGGLIESGGKICGVRLVGPSGSETATADAYVAAMGSYTPLLVRPLGLRLPVYPAKGYSATVPLSENSVAPYVAMTDDGHKLVFSRLGQRLRIAGTAEFNGYNMELNSVRCQAIMQRAKVLFPELNPAGEPEYWCGLRPSTPSNVPFIGQTRWPNLYLNTGHGTLGWTMACGSGAALADLISGREPEVDLKPASPLRI